MSIRKLSKNTAKANLIKGAANSSNDPKKSYNVTEAIELLKQMSYTKFDQTVELAIKLGIDPKQSNQVVQGVAQLPAGSGKNIKVAVICPPELTKAVLDAGADAVDEGEAIIENIKSGNINFDVYITTPSKMSKLGPVARILGPKGLMPTVKFGTVTEDVVSAVKNAKSGKVNFRNEKGAIIHAGVGKLSFNSESLKSNLISIVEAVMKAKPATAKGRYIKDISICATMTPSLKLQIDELVSK